MFLHIYYLNGKTLRRGMPQARASLLQDMDYSLGIEVRIDFAAETRLRLQS